MINDTLSREREWSVGGQEWERERGSQDDRLGCFVCSVFGSLLSFRGGGREVCPGMDRVVPGKGWRERPGEGVLTGRGTARNYYDDETAATDERARTSPPFIPRDRPSPTVWTTTAFNVHYGYAKRTNGMCETHDCGRRRLGDRQRLFPRPPRRPPVTDLSSHVRAIYDP